MDRLIAALDALTFGVALLDRDRRVVFLNEIARQMCRDRVGICKYDRTISAVWPAEKRRLTDLTANACSWPLRHNQPLLLHDDAGKPIAIVFAHALRASETEDGPDDAPSAVLFVRSLNGHAKLTHDALRRLFRMTEAEAALVIALYVGKTLAEASRSLGKSVSTLRTQLRAAFGKTNTRRQVDLLRVIDRAVRP